MKFWEILEFSIDWPSLSKQVDINNIFDIVVSFIVFFDQSSDYFGEKIFWFLYVHVGYIEWWALYFTGWTFMFFHWKLLSDTVIYIPNQSWLFNVWFYRLFLYRLLFNRSNEIFSWLFNLWYKLALEFFVSILQLLQLLSSKLKLQIYFLMTYTYLFGNL